MDPNATYTPITLDQFFMQFWTNAAKGKKVLDKNIRSAQSCRHLPPKFTSRHTPLGLLQSKRTSFGTVAVKAHTVRTVVVEAHTVGTVAVKAHTI
ncbi:hypothetical protein RRG08_055399 [Elysia crispata]|uniref:Uncharacterized protein n=1 Tax=Elysia crispata TaxID=231223 RepID=A0AAE1E2R3_9GAST|nr:hypothetical protein RRG08_055399 [Elysia crispata]